MVINIKKNILIILSILSIIIIIILYFILTNNQKNKISPFSKYSFYKNDYEERYQKYKEKYNLNDKDTIIKVNIGLDNDFYTNIKKTNNLNTNYVLVNKYLSLDENYVPDNLVELKEFSRSNIFLVKEAYEAFKKMAIDALSNNLNIRIVSAYRSYNYQKNLYNNYLKYDTLEKVDTYSARSGHSEHQTGLAIDIDNIVISYDKFHLTQEFTWVKNNCHKYGFILRYDTSKEKITGYKYEPWHYRYVGTKISDYIYKNNLTLEEYYYEFID